MALTPNPAGGADSAQMIRGTHTGSHINPKKTQPLNKTIRHRLCRDCLSLCPCSRWLVLSLGPGHLWFILPRLSRARSCFQDHRAATARVEVVGDRPEWPQGSQYSGLKNLFTTYHFRIARECEPAPLLLTADWRPAQANKTASLDEMTSLGRRLPAR